jgi:asparagine synthase (glutamine-hydrolysing)
VFDYDVHGFTAVNTDARYSEQGMVDHAVAELDVRHTQVRLETDGFLEGMRTLVRHHDSPVSTIAFYIRWLLLRVIHEAGYRVSITGAAADELFTGYYDHHLFHLREVHADAELHAATLAGWREHVAPIVRNPYLSDPDRFVRDPGFRDHIYLGADEFRGYLTADFDEPFAERRFTGDLLRNRMLNELFHEAIPVILDGDDLVAMYYSIENRSPFLDRELFEFALSIPTRHLIAQGRAKFVLREAMRGIVPDLILDNPRKVGFNAPIESLLDVDDPAVRAELLADGPLWELVRRDRVTALLSERNLPNSVSKLLFNLLNVKLFLEEVA